MKRRYAVLFLSLVLALALAVPALGGPSNPVASVSASAKGIANKALKKAKAAQSTANTALSNAAGAQSSANTAQSSANTALKEAKSAQTSAKAAQTTANEAKTAAANAQTTANSKFGRTEFVVGASSGPETTLGLSIAECGPVGGTITGGGYTAGGAGNNEVVPIYTGAYGNAWLADLERIPGGTNTWEVSALATCAKP
jgi:hypothetical protein